MGVGIYFLYILEKSIEVAKGASTLHLSPLNLQPFRD